MTGIIIDIDTNAESAKKDLQSINKSLAALINSSKATGKSVGGISPDSFKNLNYSVRQTDQAMARFQTTSRSAIGETTKAASGMSEVFNSVKNAALALGSTFLAIKGVGAFNKVADDLTLVQNRLKLTIKDSDQLLQKQRQLFKVAQDTRSDFKTTVSTYSSFAASLQASGIAGSRLNGIVKTLNQGIALSGSSAESANAALIQLGQGISSGAVRGEELNSVLEQLPYIGQGIARSLNMTVAQLRTFAAAGGTSANVIVQALEKMADRADKDFGATTATAADATKQLGQSVSYFFAQLNQKSGSTDRFAKNVLKVSDVFASGADRIFAKSYTMQQGLRNWISQLDMFDASTLVVKGIIDLDISPVDAYQKYKAYKAVKSGIESIKNFFGTKPTFQLDADVKTNGLFDAFTQSSADIKAAGDTINGMQGVLNNFKRLGTAAADSVAITFTNLGRLIPKIGTPVINLFDSWQRDLYLLKVNAQAISYDKIIPFGRALESISQQLNGFSTDDNKLERSWVDLFKSKSLVEFTSNLEKLNVVRKQLRWDDKSFLGRELVRSVRSNAYEVQNFLISLGVLDNQLIRIRDTRLDRLAMYFSNIGRVVKRVYQDVFATTFEPIAKRIFSALGLSVVTFFDSLTFIFNPNTGRALAENFIDGFLTGTQGLFNFWENWESGKIDFTNIFGPDFTGTIQKTLGVALVSIGGFVTSFFSTIGKSISNGLTSGVFATAFSDVSSSIRKAIKQTREEFSVYNALFKDMGTKNFKLSEVFDVGGLVGSFAYVLQMFREVLGKVDDLTGKIARKVVNFCTVVKDEFFLVYDEVVGHSYWPDTIDEINSYTDKLFVSESRISRFATTVKTLFSNVYDLLVKAGTGAGGSIADFTVRITKVDYKAAFRDLRQEVVAIIASGLALAFIPNVKVKVAAASYLAGLVNSALGGAFTAFSSVAGAAIGNVTAELAASTVKGAITGLGLAIQAIPAFAQSFVKALLPQQDYIMNLFNFVPFLGNSLVGSIAAVGAAYALFAKGGRKTITELIFGTKGDKKNPATDGVFQYAQAMFPKLLGKSDENGLVSTLFPQKKLALLGGLALASAMTDAVSLFEAAQVGLPLLAFAMLGKDNGATLARNVASMGEKVIVGAYGKFTDVIGKLSGKESWVYTLFTSPLSMLKSSTDGPVKTAVDAFGKSIGTAIRNMRKNADLYGAGAINFGQMFTESFNFSKVGPTIPGEVPELKKKLITLYQSLVDFKLPGSATGGTLGQAIQAMALTATLGLARVRLALDGFKVGLSKVFSAGLGGALSVISLLTDGLRGLFSIIGNKFALFALLAAGLTGTAFAAADAASAMHVVTSSAMDIVSVIGKTVVAFAALGVAYRAFQKYTEGKGILASAKAGTLVTASYDDALAAFKVAQATKSEDVIAKAVSAERNKLNKLALATEKGMIFASEAEKLQFRTAARARNESVLAAFEKRVVADQAARSLAGLDVFERDFKKSQDRITKISGAKTSVGAGLASTAFYFQDLFANGYAAAKKFTQSLKSGGLDSSPFQSFADKAGRILSTVFRLPEGAFDSFTKAFTTISIGLDALKGARVSGVVTLFQGIGQAALASGGLVVDMAKGIGRSMASLSVVITAVRAGISALGTSLAAVLAPLLAIVAPIAGTIAIVTAVAGVVGALGLWLFGPNDTFIDNLEYAYDKIKGIFGLANTTNGGRKSTINGLVGGKTTVGDQSADFSAQLRTIDFGKLNDTQYKIAEDSAKTTKDAFNNLNEVFVKQGRFTDENLKELAKIKQDQADIFKRLPQKDDQTYAAATAQTQAKFSPIGTLDTSFFDMLKNLVGWKPVLQSTVKDIGGVQKALTSAGNAFTSWPAIILGAIGTVVAPGIGTAIGASVGALISVLADSVIDGLAWIGKEIVNSRWYKWTTTQADQIVEVSENKVKNWGASIASTFRDWVDTLKNVPNDLEKGIAARFDKANGTLPQFSTALPGDVQAQIQDSFDKASEAAENYADLMRKGSNRSNSRDLDDFTRKLKDARLAYEVTMKQYEALTSTNSPIAESLFRTKELTDAQKVLFEQAKTTLGYDFGTDGEDFIGGKGDMAEIQGYVDQVKKLKEDLKLTYDLSDRRKINLDIESVKQKMANLGDYIKNAGFLNKDIELKIKVTGDAATADDLKRLFVIDPAAYASLNLYSKQYSKVMSDISNITIDTPADKVKELYASANFLRTAVIKRLPNATLFTDVNDQITALGGAALTLKAFGSLTPENFKALNDAAAKVKLLKVDLENLKVSGGTSEQQFKILKDLDTTTQSYLGTVDQVNAKTIKDIVSDKSLGNATKAYTVSKQLGTTIPETISTSSKAMSRWATIQVEMAQAQVELNRLIQEGGSDSNDQIVALGAKMAGFNREISLMSEKTVFGFDELISKLNETGLAITDVNFAKLNKGAQSSLLSIGTQLQAISKKMSDSSAAGLVGGDLSALIAKRQALLEKARAQMVDAMYNTGTGVTDGLNRIGLSEFSDIASLAGDKVKALLNIDKLLEQAKFDLGNTTSLAGYVKVSKTVADLQQKAARQIELATLNFTTRAGAINEVFSTGLDDNALAHLGDPLFNQLSAYAVQLKHDLADATKFGVTSAGESLASVFDRMTEAAHTGAYVAFFANLKKDISDSFTNGAQTSFDKLSSALGDIKLSFQDFLQIPDATRRAFDQQASIMARFKEAINLPDLSSEMTDVLNDPSKSMEDILTTFKDKFSAELGDKIGFLTDGTKDIVSPIEANTAALIASTAAYRGQPAPAVELAASTVSAVSDVAKPNTGITKATGKRLLTEPLIAALKLARTASAGGDNDKERLAPLSKGLGLNFDSDTLNLASAKQLKEATAMANAMADKQEELNNAIQNGLPTRDLAVSVETYKAKLADLATGINDSALKVYNAGKTLSSSVSSNFNTAFSDLLKGKSDDDSSVIKTFMDSILDNITSSILDSFVSGLLDPLTGDNGIVTKALSGLGESLFTTGGDTTKGLGGLFGSVKGFFGGGSPDGSKASDYSGVASFVSGQPADEITDGVSGAILASTDAQQGFFADLGSTFMNGIGGLGDLFGKGLNALGSVLGSLFGGGGGGGSSALQWLSIASSVFSAGAGAYSGMASGGGSAISDYTGSEFSDWVKAANKKAAGGYVTGPGTGTSDSIPHMLSNGEFVVNAKATRQNIGLLNRMNNGQLTGLATGGLVGPSVLAMPSTADVSPTNTTASSSQQVFNINITGDISRQTKATIVQMLPEIAGGVNKHNREKNIR